MQLEGNTIWLLVDELVSYNTGINTIWTGLKRNRLGAPGWKHKDHPSDKRIKLIDYDSLPESTKIKLPSKEELIRNHEADTVEEKLQKVSEAHYLVSQLHKENCDILDYHFFIKKVLDKTKANDLMLAAGWLRFLSKYRTPKETRTIDFNTKAELREAVVEKLIADAKAKRGQHLYGFKVTNAKVLQRKELEWANAIETAKVNSPIIEANRAGLATLVHENIGNNNRRVLGKINEDEKERILLPGGKVDFSEWNARTLVWYYMNPDNGNKFDFENIYRRYQYKCKQENKPVAVSLSAIKDFLTTNEVKLYTTRERHGWAELDKMLPHVYGKRSQYSLSKGGYDGFVVDFNTRENGKQFMLTVVAMFDYMSEAVTGFDVGYVEDGKMVRTMYRNHLNQFGGRSYIEVESDRFSGNLAEETRGIFEKCCQYVTQPTPNDPQAKAPNPKGRFVERLIQELNRLTQNVEGWKGTNITSVDKNRKPNPDYRTGNYLSGYSESVSQIIDLINVYNNDCYNREKSRMQVCLENINPDAPQIPLENISLLLNQSTTVKVTSGLVAFEVNRKFYEYAFPEFDQHVHAMMKGYKVKVFYDETDMETVDVFGEKEQYIATLGKLRRIVKAKAEQTEDDLRGAGAMRARRNQSVDRIQGVTRKVLEAQASDLGIDISNMELTEAQEVIAGIMEISTKELFAEALATPNAQQTRAYYEDRLIRANGDAVPIEITKEEARSSEQMLREQARKKFNKPN